MDDKLLTDEEFTELMDAAYHAAGKPVDEIGKARTWNRIRRRLGGNKRQKERQFFWGQIAALAAVLVMGVSFYLVQQGSDVTRPKGDATPLPVQLRAFVLEENGNLQILTGDQVELGATVVFKVSLNQDGAGSLFLLDSVAEGSPVEATPNQPEVVVPEQMYEAGPEHLLGTGEDTYGYRFASPGGIRACFLAAADAADLRLWLTELSDEVLQQATCITISTVGTGTP